MAFFRVRKKKLNQLNKFKKENREACITQNSRAYHVDQILTEEEKEKRQAIIRKHNRNIGLALFSFGCATLGYTFYPLKLVSVSITLFLAGHFYKKAAILLSKRQVGIPTLMVVSLTGAITFGYIWAASFIMIIAQLAKKLTALVVSDSHASLIDVFRQTPNTAWVLVDDTEIQVPLAKVSPGQIVVVGAGEMIPVDGVVIAGIATVDQHLLTGEAQPIEKSSSDLVFAGTVVLSGRLKISVEKAGEQTTAARIGQILNDTKEYKSTAQLRAEDLAQRTVMPTLIAGVIAVPLLGPMSGLAVIDSHFRQRMSILAPLSLLNYLKIAARSGILIKDGRSLDLLSQVDTLVFDKTGTLTEEHPIVGTIHPCANIDAEEILRYAAAAEQKQTHPIAYAILEEAKWRNISIPVLEESDYKLGYGLTVKTEGRNVQVGSRRLMESLRLEIPPTLDLLFDEAHRLGHSVVMVACDDAIIGAIELKPSVRPMAKQVIDDLRQHYGIQSTYIISGDHDEPTRQLAQELNIDHYFAETLPEQKAELIEKLVNEGHFVCYIGDGINDAIALKKSHVSISLRGASSVALDTAQIVLMESELVQLTDLFELAHGFHSNTNRAFNIAVMPTVIGIGGVLFLQFGLIQTALLSIISLFVGIGNAMLPRYQYREKLLLPNDANQTK